MIYIYDKKTPYAVAMRANGLFTLDKLVISAETTEDISGNYELSIELELQGDAPVQLYEMLQADNIIKVNDEGSEELFRIAQVNKGLDTIELYCRHITIADSLNLWLDNVKPTDLNGAAALQWLAARTVPECKILFSSNISNVSTADYVRKNLYEALFEGDNAFIKRWGGEVKRTGYTVRIDDKIGQDKTDVIKIKEALNLTEFNAKTNIDEVTTVIYPIGFDGITAPRVVSKLVNNYSMEFPAEIKYEDVKVRKVDESGQVTEEGFATEEEARAELKRRAEAEFNEKHIDQLQFVCDIDFLDLNKFEEYKDLTQLQTVNLGDYVSVRVETFDLDISARIVARKFDVLRGRRIESTLSTDGEIRKPVDIKDVIKDFVDKVQAEGVGDLSGYIDSMIQQGFKNGYVIYDKNACYAVDKLPKEQAKNVVVLNSKGLGYSSTGIQGPYKYGFTIDGKLNADMITTGTLGGQYIAAGTIEANKLSVNAKKEITNGLATNSKVVQLEADINGISTKVGEIDDTIKNWRVGGYNYLINSDISLNDTMLEHMYRPAFKDVEAPAELEGETITLSVDIDAVDVVWLNGNRSRRAGWELAVEFTDGGVQYLGCWYSISDPATYKNRLCKTYTLPKGRKIRAMNRQTSLYIQGFENGSITVSRPKLEIGNVCTDWSANKLDTDGVIGEIKEEISTIKQTNSEISTKVQSNTTQIQAVDGKFVNYVSNSKFTEFKQTSEAFDFNVENRGIRNLVKGANGIKADTDGFWGSRRYGTSLSPSWWTINPAENQWAYPDKNVFTFQLKEYSNQALNGGDMGIIQENIPVQVGETYTFSCYVAAHRAADCFCYLRGYKGDKWALANSWAGTPATGGTDKNNWTRIKVTFTATMDTIGVELGIRNRSGNDPYLWFAKPMLNKGKLAQEYTDNDREVHAGRTRIDVNGIRCDFDGGTYAEMGRNGFAYKHASWSHPYQYVTKVLKVSKKRNGYWHKFYLGDEFKGKQLDADFKLTHYIGAVDCNAYVETGQYGGALRTSFTEVRNWNPNEASIEARCCIQKITLKTEVFFGWDKATTDTHKGGIIGESAGDIILIAQM